MSRNENPARISLYNIIESGLYQRNVDEPIFGDLEIFLDDLMAWVTDGRPLRETSTYAELDHDLHKTFCYDIKKSPASKNFLLITWNKISDATNTVAKISGSSKVGEASISTSTLDPDDIPGFPTYFWIMPESKQIATINFDYAQNGRNDLHRYLKDFMSKWSRYSFSILNDDGERVVQYWMDTNDPDKKFKHLYGRFNTKLVRNQGKIATLLNNWELVRKVHQHNKISVKDLVKIPRISVVNKIFSLSHDASHDVDIKFKLEADRTFQSREELEALIKEWEGQTDLTKWDDLGFSLQGDRNNILWLSSSLANTTLGCPLERNKNSIFSSDSLVTWLDSITPKILKLDEASSESP
ncbi:hypothetical protein HXZ76_02440 [Acinetobacter indicus]|uniref:hypothetical protein n=1 Tax=Acinetobacter indicus TaxID=756892 RepID=UPI002575F7F4|nr:hypothetical protein [Acinetobacter indicus]MDM1303188.1 hypothetical protein [Acinetobacter indicus]